MGSIAIMGKGRSEASKNKSGNPNKPQVVRQVTGVTRHVVRSFNGYFARLAGALHQ